jgi:hypothetical protein
VKLRLALEQGLLAVARLDPDAPFPVWATGGPVVSLTRTAGELSVVCPQDRVPAGVRAERGFRALRVEGPLDFALTGVLAALSSALAGAGVPLLAIGTYDTDWLLVPETRLGEALGALRAAGHELG